MNAEHRRGLLLGAAAYTCWGLLSPGNEILLRDMTPMWLQAIRGGLAFLLPALYFGRKRIAKAVRILRQPQLFGALFVGTFLSFALFIWAQTRIPAAYTTLGFYTAPLWTALFGWLWLRENPGWAFVPAVSALSIGGWIALTDAGNVPGPDGWGMALAIASGLTWGVYAVLLRRHAKALDWQDLLLASTLLGAVGFLLCALVLEPIPDITAYSNTTWLWTGIQVAIPTLAALAMFQSALRLAPSAQVNALVALELAATVFFAWLLLNVAFGPVELLGIWICLVAVAGYLWWQSNDAGSQQTADAQ